MPASNSLLASARQKLNLIRPRLGFHTDVIPYFKRLYQKPNASETEVMSPYAIESADCSDSEAFVRLYKEKDEETVMEIVSCIYLPLNPITSIQSTCLYLLATYRQIPNEVQCRETAHRSAQLEPARTVVAYVFALPYLQIHPEYTWVVDDGTGKAVGYIVAVPDSKVYLDRIKSEYLPNLTASDPVRWAPPTISGDGSINMPPVVAPGNEIERVGRDGGPEKVAEALMNRLWHPDDSILHLAWPDLIRQYPCHLHIDILPEYQSRGFGSKLMKELVVKLREKGVHGLHIMKGGGTIELEEFYQKVGFKRYPVDMGGGKPGEQGVKPGGGVCMVMEV